MSTILALICIIMGFIVGIIDEKVLFDSVAWFIAAIAFALLPLPGIGPFVVTKRE
jgi:hypothetical protein